MPSKYDQVLESFSDSWIIVLRAEVVLSSYSTGLSSQPRKKSTCNFGKSGCLSFCLSQKNKKQHLTWFLTSASPGSRFTTTYVYTGGSYHLYSDWRHDEKLLQALPLFWVLLGIKLPVACVIRLTDIRVNISREIRSGKVLWVVVSTLVP